MIPRFATGRDGDWPSRGRGLDPAGPRRVSPLKAAGIVYHDRMKPCAAAQLSGTALLLALGFAGCAGGRETAPPPETAATESASTAAKEPAPSTDPAGPAASATEPAKGTPSPSASAGEDSGPETRTLDAISAIVKTHRAEARACYEKALKDTPGLKGDMVIHFIVTPEGKVKTSEVNAERSTMTNAAVSQCVISVIRSLSFPESSKGMESTVNYPFNFKP